MDNIVNPMDSSMSENFVTEVMAVGNMFPTSTQIKGTTKSKGRERLHSWKRPAENSAEVLECEEPTCKKSKGEPKDNFNDRFDEMLKMMSCLGEQINTQIASHMDNLEKKIEEKVTNILDKRLNIEMHEEIGKIRDRQ
ncbi:hypothetical protein LOTGIDRAFT_164135 [Lottia gigantea]|uniref:Uncharacterized protein n=1 Tax=Lottia gigantea TaxID=225164 RepID=V4A1K9_LOTGI|nr:hypothetical protein LOTGIDRAFT_164135 [Lottia gigantea]ESO90547.1 hypothetical protein LOTGIDRAFT_164135 [Lottia gigantea]